uniref:C-type lectin domain-containing protein n=1 Tax=Xiphophorus couchianus TaxID=32473 RepID=A0A3B5M2A3_9TELE
VCVFVCVSRGVCVCVCSGSVSDGCCPLGWETFGSSCYLFSRSVLSWHEARDWCNGHESHLVILMSDEEWDFVTRFSAGSFYWVGLTDEKSGRWEWVNQTPYVMNRRYDLESSITWTSARWHRSGTPPCRGRQHDVGHFSS